MHTEDLIQKLQTVFRHNYSLSFIQKLSGIYAHRVGFPENRCVSFTQDSDIGLCDIVSNEEQCKVSATD